MKNSIIEKLTRLPGGMKRKIGPKWLVFLFFLILSTILWFLNALNKSYVSEINLKVKYTNFPEDKVLANAPPDELLVSVQENGFNLIRIKYFSRYTPVIDINSFSRLHKLEESKSGNDFYVLTKNLLEPVKEEMSKKHGNDLDVLEISPDTIHFQLDKVSRKKVPVKPVVKLEFDNEYNVRGSISSMPDSILISGAERIIDTIEFVETKSKTLNSVHSDKMLDVELKEYTHVRFDEKMVRLTIPVERFTEKSVKCPVQTINVPDSLYLRIFPNEVEVVFLVAISDYEVVNASLFEVIVNYNSLQESVAENPEKLKIELKTYPEYIHSPILKNKVVDFMVEKK